MSSSQRSGPFTIFLMAACAVLSVLVVLLAVQNLGLKKQLSGPAAAAPDDNALVEGEVLEQLTVISEDGEVGPIEFGRGEDRTLLLFFSVHCGACEQTFPIWEELVADIQDTPGLRILGVQTDLDDSTESDPSAILPPAFPFEILGVDYGASESMARIPYIPAAIALDARGVIEGVWFGRPGDDDIRKMRELLGA